MPARIQRKSKRATQTQQTRAETSKVPAKPLSRTRMRTRSRLIDAALNVMGTKGVDGTSIAEITAKAEVGFGSFYSNFGSIDQLAGEVFAIRAEVLARQLNTINERVKDPALAASFIQRWFIETAVHDRVWGWFLIHADAALQQMEMTFRERVRSDMQRGLDLGRYDFRGIETAVTVTLTSLVAVMRRILEGKGKPSIANDMVELLLRMYGIPHPEARHLAHEKLPQWIGDSE